MSNKKVSKFNKRLIMASLIGGLIMGGLGYGTSAAMNHGHEKIFGTPTEAHARAVAKYEQEHDTTLVTTPEDDSIWIARHTERTQQNNGKLSKLMTTLFMAAGLILAPVLAGNGKETR